MKSLGLDFTILPQSALASLIQRNYIECFLDFRVKILFARINIFLSYRENLEANMNNNPGYHFN